jgi:hypothetical protein
MYRDARGNGFLNYPHFGNGHRTDAPKANGVLKNYRYVRYTGSGGTCTPSDPISFCRGARVLALDARRAVDGRAKGGCARVAAFVRRDDAIHGALAGAAAPRPQHPGMERLGCHATDGKDAIRYARAAPSLHSLACCMVRPHAGIAGLAKLELFQTGGVAEDHRGAGHSCGHTHGH